MIKACIFDLDGVIVDTAKYHFIAWRKLANELGFDFTEKENEKLKGVSRMGSLNLILEWGGIKMEEDKKVEWATKKNEWYKEHILDMGEEEILPGVRQFLNELKAKNIQYALGSASKNAAAVMNKIGLTEEFVTIIDGTKTTKGKPDPQVFQMGAEAMGVQAEECIVFEDAAKGVQAALNGNFYAVGVGSPESLGAAHMVISGFEGLTFDQVLQGIQ
ncbi:MAG: beta-phosphoglucomutase [Saprospiraceae bacterium]|nr:beta-phosphoglucomutase [Saprospiraceae bacterium]